VSLCRGAAIALETSLHEYVERIHINDVSRPVHAFWKSVLDHTEALCKLVRHKADCLRHGTSSVYDRAPKEHDALTLGFATFFSIAQTAQEF